MINFYVYKLDDPITGEYYYGSRQCHCPIKDDTYMGSYVSWKPKDKSRLIKTIVKSNFRKRETAVKYESKLIKEHIDNKLNRNYHIPPNTFRYTGRPSHPFTTNKAMKKWCNYFNVECNTNDGSDVDWETVNWIRNIGDPIIEPTPIEEIELSHPKRCMITIAKTEYVMGMTRPAGY